jgi:hypothetical protein
MKSLGPTLQRAPYWLTRNSGPSGAPKSAQALLGVKWGVLGGGAFPVIGSD